MQAPDLPNLRDTPFRLGASPADAVAHRSWRAVHGGVLTALAEGSARIAVPGSAGSGKTLLLHVLAGELRNRGRIVRVTGSDSVPADLPDNAILFVDDADRLDDNTLTCLAERDGACVLAGPTTFARRLPASFSVLALSPLPPDEVARFVAVRLAAAGQRRDLLAPDAVLALARLSGGVPRQVNALAGAALFLAGLDGAARVSRRYVEEAAAMRDGDVDVAPTPVPVAEPKPLDALAAEQVAPPQAMAGPLAPGRSRRARPIAVMAAVSAGLLLLVGAVLAGNSRDGASAGRGPASISAASTQPAASPPQAAIVPPLPVPAPKPFASEAPGAAVPGPVVAVWASHSRATLTREPAPLPAAFEPAAASGLRVVLHYREGAAAEADYLVSILAGQGPTFGRIETRAVPDTPRVATIRFFHPEDIGAARQLQTALSATGDDWQVRDFTRYQPRPRRGTLEAWIRRR